MAVPTGALYRLSLAYQVAGEICQNVLYCRGADNTVTAALMVNAGINDIAAAFRTVQCTSVLYQSCTAVEVVRFGSQDTAEAAMTGVTGNLAVLAEAPQLAVCFNNRTGQFGRTRRGRFFLGGIPDGEVEGGKIKASFATTINTMLATLSGRIVGASATSAARLGVFSRERYKIISNPFDEYWAMSQSLGYVSVMSTMRSRRPRA